MSYRRKGPVDGVDYEPMKEPRYGEIATFMRAPYKPDLEGVEVELERRRDERDHRGDDEAAEGDEVVEEAQGRVAIEKDAELLGGLAQRRRHRVLARIAGAARQGVVAGAPAEGEGAPCQGVAGPAVVERADEDRHGRAAQIIARDRQSGKGGQARRDLFSETLHGAHYGRSPARCKTALFLLRWPKAYGV